jgi:hypothetical protein
LERGLGGRAAQVESDDGDFFLARLNDQGFGVERVKHSL